MYDLKGAKPTGIPGDAVAAAAAINAEIGRRVNLPGPNRVGVLLAGAGSDHIGALAQVSMALSLADIAQSLRTLADRNPAPAEQNPADGQ